MSSAEFYRREADRMLRKAEEAEHIEKLKSVVIHGDPTIVTFVRRGSGVLMNYAAIRVLSESVSIDAIDTSRGRWYLTQGGYARIKPMTDTAFVEWLVNHGAEDVQVCTEFVPVEDWRPKAPEITKS